MANQILLSTNGNVTNKVNNMGEMADETLRFMSGTLDKPFRLLRDYYAKVLEHPVSHRQARALTMAQVAFFATVLPADYPLSLRFAACAWFIVSLHKCKQIV